MPSDSKRSLILAAILALALLAMLGILGRDVLQSRVFGKARGYAFVTDIDRWRKTRRERVVRARYDLSLGPQLHDLPLELGDWAGEDIPQDNIEVQILLEPEEYVYRRYRRADGKIIWLSVIGSRQSKSFHPPQICYDAAGWATEIASEPIALAKGDFYALKVEAKKDAWTHIVLYFYLYPDYLRDQSKGVVLFKVTAPMGASEEETLELEKNFLRHIFFEAGAHL
ncbi:MAG TPA: exosortase-associated EpsI family protein [Anaerolineae bacterium]|nr:exosortase-associated EpsI family protein [Anaerolineae bacterium]